VYSLLMAAMDGAWDMPTYELDRSRLGEYTTHKMEERLKTLDAKLIEELMSLPSLFAVEGTIHDWHVGHVSSVKIRGTRLVIQHEFDEAIAPIPYSRIKPLLKKLHIEPDEIHRTHWAIKDKSLHDVLEAAGLLDGYARPAPGRIEDLRFKVALSFPGEVRPYVEQVARELRRRLPPGLLFYDNDYKAQLAKPNLDKVLQLVYGKQSDLVVVFLCAKYDEKPWCGVEWRAIRNVIIGKNDHAVMFMRSDDAVIPGVFPHDGYIDINRHTEKEVASLILERVRLNDLDGVSG
jgi:hypothetical protein